VILIITNKEDVHPTPVIEYLSEKQIPVFRLNTESLLSDYQFNWWCNDTETDFYIKNTKNGLELKGSEITAVWERRPELPKELPIDNIPEINEHNLKEARGFLSFLRYFLKDVYSIGSIVFDKVSASKMLQLKTAQDLGITIPATCFSNRKEDIVNFAKNHEYVILKSIENDNIWLNDEHEYLFYAQKVKSSLLSENPDEMFSQTVNYVQNYIEKQFELRITALRYNQIFACKIDSQILDEDKGKIDWRQGYDYGLKYEPFELPKKIYHFCSMYLEKMNLNFGCFDMIVTPENEYVFLECNPNGQWLWIEFETGMKISVAIADTLSSSIAKLTTENSKEMSRILSIKELYKNE
jgi:glutathione synthase/RimK-type ligase-like ATP-grasp enzyme